MVKKYNCVFLCIHKTDDFYKYIAENDEARLDTLNYKLDRPLPKGKNKKNRLMKYKLCRNIK